MSSPIRILIIVLCIVVTSFTLQVFALQIGDVIAVSYNWCFELLAVTGMILFQLPFLYRRTLQEKIGYYYYMLQVSLYGSLLLWPAIIWSLWTHPGTTALLCWFFTVVLIMFVIHRRYVARLHMPGILSYTWVLYRVFLLAFIL